MNHCNLHGLNLVLKIEGAKHVRVEELFLCFSNYFCDADFPFFEI